MSTLPPLTQVRVNANSVPGEYNPGRDRMGGMVGEGELRIGDKSVVHSVRCSVYWSIPPSLPPIISLLGTMAPSLKATGIS